MSVADVAAVVAALWRVVSAATTAAAAFGVVAWRYFSIERTLDAPKSAAVA